jgi:hypothetical protein
MPTDTLQRVGALLDRALTASENEDGLFNVRPDEALSRALTVEALVRARNAALQTAKLEYEHSQWTPVPLDDEPDPEGRNRG